MDIIQLIIFGLVTTLIYLSLRELQPNIALLVVIIASIIILISVLKQIQFIIIFLKSLGQKAMIQTFYLDTIFKIIGIAYVAEIGANITKDAGLTAISSKIELAAKIFILILAIPIIQAVIEVILQFIPSVGSL